MGAAHCTSRCDQMSVEYFRQSMLAELACDLQATGSYHAVVVQAPSVSREVHRHGMICHPVHNLAGTNCLSVMGFAYDSLGSRLVVEVS